MQGECGFAIAVWNATLIDWLPFISSPPSHSHFPSPRPASTRPSQGITAER